MSVNINKRESGLYIKHALMKMYNLKVSKIEKVSLSFYNEHYIASSSDGLIHIKVYNMKDAYSKKDRLEEVLYSHNIVNSLVDVGCGLVPKYLRTVGGRTLAYNENIIFDVVKHINCTPHEEVKSEIMGRMLSELHNSISKINVSDRPGHSSLRFAGIEQSIEYIINRVSHWVRKYLEKEDHKRIESYIKITKEWWRRYTQRPLGRSILHGDYEKSNILISKQGKKYIIDFDCSYVDIKEIDVAHGMLSTSCSNYFCGELDKGKLYKFANGYYKDAHQCEVLLNDLKYICVYVILKKICLVRNPQNLHIKERLSIIENLLSIK